MNGTPRGGKIVDHVHSVGRGYTCMSNNAFYIDQTVYMMSIVTFSYDT